MKIKVDLMRNTFIEYEFKGKDCFDKPAKFQGFFLSGFDGQKINLIAIKNNRSNTTVYKNVQFKDGNVLVNFDNGKVKIGTYQEI